MIRDLCLRRMPFVLNKRIYAVASLLGGAVYYALFKLTPAPEYIALLSGVAFVVAVRILAIVFKLNMPKAIIFEKEIGK